MQLVQLHQLVAQADRLGDGSLALRHEQVEARRLVLTCDPGEHGMRIASLIVSVPIA